LSKAVVTRYVGAKDSLASERSYTVKTLPEGVLCGLRAALFQRDVAGLARATAIVVGLIVTAAGYLVGMTYARNRRSNKPSLIEEGLSQAPELLLPVKTRS
jgi:hypothetical protein